MRVMHVWAIYFPWHRHQVNESTASSVSSEKQRQGGVNEFRNGSRCNRAPVSSTDSPALVEPPRPGSADSCCNTISTVHTYQWEERATRCSRFGMRIVLAWHLTSYPESDDGGHRWTRFSRRYRLRVCVSHISERNTTIWHIDLNSSCFIDQ